jgi:1-deoxy-D-xylulose-5-phosphate synthase
VIEFLSDEEILHVKVRRIGLPDEFICQGGQDKLRRKYGIDEEGIYQAVLTFLKESHLETDKVIPEYL